jgi:hypothetical protein
LRDQTKRLRRKISKTLLKEFHQNTLTEGQFMVRLAIDGYDSKGKDIPLPMFKLRFR